MGTKIINKVLDNSGTLKQDYWNIRYLRNGVVSGGYQIELRHAVEDDVENSEGVIGLERVEWRGSHIGEEWRNVTEWYRNAYHERSTGDET